MGADAATVRPAPHVRPGAEERPPADVAVLAWPGQRGSRELVAGWRALGLDAALVAPTSALAVLAPRVPELVRLDVLRTLDGVEPGLAEIRELEQRGRVVLNRADALLSVHDKLESAAVLARAGVPQPETGHVDDPWAPLPVPAPLVVKPRFGSWGRDVARCWTAAEARLHLLEVAQRPWFRRHGALVQELVRSDPADLRLLVAGGRVVGAALRRVAPGEWRTNVSLGGTIEPVEPPAVACALALRAAAAVGTDFVGVDLLRHGRGWIVLELNGAVDFDRRYSLPGRDVFRDSADALGIPVRIDERSSP